MNTKLVLEYVMFAEVFLCLAILGVMWQKSLVRKFAALAAFLVVLVVGTIISIATLFFRRRLGISQALDYEIYFIASWTTFFLSCSLRLLIIYDVFRNALKPLEGLHRASTIIFRWVSGASLAVAISFVVGTPAVPSASYIQTISTQIQQTTSILTICLLLFVCFAVRYLGLTYRSHIFGISLGLGVYATVSLVEAAWFTTPASKSLYSPLYLYSALGTSVAFLVWGAYFALPEPAARMVLLPTSSPFFFWNRRQVARGNYPGVIASAGAGGD